MTFGPRYHQRRQERQERRRTSDLGRRIESLGFAHEAIGTGDYFVLEASEGATIATVEDAASGVAADLPSDPEHLVLTIYRHPGEKIVCEEMSLADLEEIVRVFREPIPECLGERRASDADLAAVVGLFEGGAR